MALDKVNRTIQQFREDVLNRGGPQIASMYQVTLAHTLQSPIVCYPVSVVVPGRQFVFFEHDLWGPNRRVPYKRSYTQCHMTFIIYQDWAERTYIENWMNSIIKNSTSSGVSISSGNLSNPSTVAEANLSTALNNSLSSGGPLSADAQFPGNYEDYVDYFNGLGTVEINFLNSSTKNPESPNRRITLKEAFPAQLNQFAMAADGTSYPMFNVTFQFNNYLYQ